MKLSLVISALFVAAYAKSDIVLPPSVPAVEPSFVDGQSAQQHGLGPVVRIGNKRATVQNEGFSTGDMASSFNTGNSPIEIVQEVVPQLPKIRTSSKRDIPLEGFKPFVNPGSEIPTNGLHGPVIRTPRSRLHRHSSKRHVRRHREEKSV